MNYAINRLLERKDIFADLINGALFGGREMLHPISMELLSPNSGTIYRDEKGNIKVKEYNGDIRMKASEERYSLIVASEPQDSVHYAMPVRMMEYISMEYRKQIQDMEKKYKENAISMTGDEFLSGIRKEDKVIPVIAVVLYCDGENEWDGSRSLYDMIDWGKNQAMDYEMKRYVADFQLNIIQTSDLREVEVFKTSLQYIFEMLKYSKDKEKLKNFIKEHETQLNQFDTVEATAAFALLGHTKMVEKLLFESKDDKDEEGGFKMCSALQEMIRDGEMIGEARGIANINKLVQMLIELNRLDDFLRSTNDAEYQKQLFEEFNII